MTSKCPEVMTAEVSGESTRCMRSRMRSHVNRRETRVISRETTDVENSSDGRLRENSGATLQQPKDVDGKLMSTEDKLEGDKHTLRLAHC